MITRRTAALAAVGGGLLAAAGGLVALVSAHGAAPGPSASPSASPWPPVRTLDGGGTYPALDAADYYCHGMTFKHDWLVFTDVSFGPGRASLILDQRPIAWIEDYYGHPIDTGTRHSRYDLSWIPKYLGHPIPDGYYLWAAQTCYLMYLGAPPSIVDDILATTAADGEKSATWDTFKATWTNNGVDGPDVVLTYRKP